MTVGLLVVRSTSSRLLVRGTYRRYFGAKRSLMPPTPPPEKKWFYKEAWVALQPKVEQLAPAKILAALKPDPSLKALQDLRGPSKGASWFRQLATVLDRGLKMAEEYGLREKFGTLFQYYCRFVLTVKDFFYQKRYRQMGTLVDDGLKKLEDKLRRTREGRIEAREAEQKRYVCGAQQLEKGAKFESAEVEKRDKKVIVKLYPKSERKE